MLKVKTLSLFLFTVLVFTTQSCINEENYLEKSKQKVESDYFDFSTKKTVQLNINYGYEGYTVLFEIYAENPLDQYDLKKPGVDPIFKCFTDNASSFVGDIEVPAQVTELYLYSTEMGVAGCVKMPITDLKASYIYSFIEEQTATRAAMARIDIGYNAREMDRYNWRSLYNAYKTVDSYIQPVYEPSNRDVTRLYQKISSYTQLTSESTLGQLLQRIKNALRTGKDNSTLAINDNASNLIVKETANDGTRLDLTLLGGYNELQHNALAYYYYKTGSNPTAQDIQKLPKFFVFPRVATNRPPMPTKVRLQFFGETGTNPIGTDLFPKGYTLGWMLVCNLYPGSDNYPSISMTSVEDRIETAYRAQRVVYSNRVANSQQQLGCISLFDKKSQRIVFGFEDQAYSSRNDKSFNDLLFYVDSDPLDAVFNSALQNEMPMLDDDIYVTEVTKGTLAFEDIWPNGGDYDLNDVIVEYESTVTFNQKNMITKVVDTFKPVNPKASASNNNAFGYVIDNNKGTIDAENSNISLEEETNQFILCPNIKEVAEQNKVFTVVRKFAPGVSKVTYKRQYNPFIVINYKVGEKNRKEVHLPKHKLTSWGDNTLVGALDDAFFIDKDGVFPFAIDIPVVNVKPVTEKVKIGSANEYPRFSNWAKSKGAKDADWYLTKDK